MKPVTAHEKRACIDIPIRKDGLYASITLFDIDQTMVPANRNSLRLRGVDKELDQFHASHATHWIAKHLAHVSRYIVISKKSIVLL